MYLRVSPVLKCDLSTEVGNERTKLSLRAVRLVTRVLANEQLLRRITQRPRGLMEWETSCLNSRSLHLYTPCRLGCIA